MILDITFVGVTVDLRCVRDVLVDCYVVLKRFFYWRRGTALDYLDAGRSCIYAAGVFK